MFERLEQLTEQQLRFLHQVICIEKDIPREFYDGIDATKVQAYVRRILHRRYRTRNLTKLERILLQRMARVFHIPLHRKMTLEEMESKVLQTFSDCIHESSYPILQLAAVFARLETPEDKEELTLLDQDGAFYKMLNHSLLGEETKTELKQLLVEPMSFSDWISNYGKRLINDKLFSQSAVLVAQVMVYSHDNASLTEQHFLQRLKELSGLSDEELEETASIELDEDKNYELGGAFIDAAFHQGITRIQDRMLKIFYRLSMTFSMAILFVLIYFVVGWSASPDFYLPLIGSITIAAIGGLFAVTMLKVWLYGSIGLHLRNFLFTLLILLFLQQNAPTVVHKGNRQTKE